MSQIDGSCPVCSISLSFQRPQMNRFRLIDEVSIYYQQICNNGKALRYMNDNNHYIIMTANSIIKLLILSKSLMTPPLDGQLQYKTFWLCQGHFQINIEIFVLLLKWLFTIVGYKHSAFTAACMCRTEKHMHINPVKTYWLI